MTGPARRRGGHLEQHTAPLVKEGENTPQERAAARRALAARYGDGRHTAADTLYFLQVLGLVDPGLQPPAGRRRRARGPRPARARSAAGGGADGVVG